MRCYSCGMELSEGSKHCLHCGAKVGNKPSSSSQNFQGEREEFRKRGRGGKRLTFPPILKIMFALMVVILGVLLYIGLR